MTIGARFWTTLIWTLLIFSTLNAQSYFFRSTGAGNLLGQRKRGVEAIGFPWLVWRESHRAGSYGLSKRAMLADVSAAVGGSVVVALFVAFGFPRFFSRWFALRGNETESLLEKSAANSPRSWQFSMRGMLTLVTFFAVAAGAVSLARTSPEVVLLLIFFCGPLIIVLISFLTQDLAAALRLAALAPAAVGMALAAVWLGTPLDARGDPTKVLLRLFVCWIPECALLALIAVIWKFRNPNFEIRNKSKSISLH